MAVIIEPIWVSVDWRLSKSTMHVLLFMRESVLYIIRPAMAKRTQKNQKLFTQQRAPN